MLLGYSVNKHCGTTLLIFTAVVNLFIMLSVTRCVFCESSAADDDKLLQNSYYFDSFFYSLMATDNSRESTHSEPAPIYTISPYLTNSTDLSHTCKHPQEKSIKEGPGPPAGQCPVSCHRSILMKNNISTVPSKKCLHYLDNADDICDMVSVRQLLKIRLKYCCEFSVKDTVYSERLLSDRTKCNRHVSFLRNLEQFIGKVMCQVEQILIRYDCHQNFSVNSCQHCRESYRRWVCSSLITHWRERHKVKPCRSVCHAVERNCPWFLPGDKNPGVAAQYAGEPVFQCIDSNIEEAGEQVLHSSYGSSGDDCCFKYCYDSSKFHPTTFTTCIVPPTDSHDAIGNERKRRDGCWKYGKLTVTNDNNNNINKNNYYNINNNNANISKFYYNIVLPSTSSSSSSLFSARRIVTFLNLHKKINVILLITTIFLFVVNYSLLFTTVIVFILFGCVN